MKAIVLAGGRGTRLVPYTTIFPKPLVPVGERPILDIVLTQLASAGFGEVTLAVGHLAELVIAYCGDGSKWGINILYSREEGPLGTAGPIARTAPNSESFLVMNGDLLTTIDFRALVKTHRDSRLLATVATFRRDVQIDLGVIEPAADGRVGAYIEKPKYSYEVSTGIYVFEPEVVKFIPRDVRFDLPDLIGELLGQNIAVGRYEMTGRWLDIGRPDDHAEATRLFEAHEDEFLAR
jgi:NDP-sugar pyrophosphorylase family protein